MIAIMSELTSALARLPHAVVRRSAGEALFHRGDPVRFLFLVNTGVAHLTRVDPGGRTAIMQRAQRGEVLAEASLFSQTYHCDGVVAADAEIVRVRKADALSAMMQDARLMAAFAAHLASEVQRVRARLEVLARRTVAERLDAWLAFHDDLLPPKGAWRVLAEEIGVSPEAFYRELARRRRF